MFARVLLEQVEAWTWRLQPDNTTELELLELTIQLNWTDICWTTNEQEHCYEPEQDDKGLNHSQDQ